MMGFNTFKARPEVWWWTKAELKRATIGNLCLFIIKVQFLVPPLDRPLSRQSGGERGLPSMSHRLKAAWRSCRPQEGRTSHGHMVGTLECSLPCFQDE